MTIWTTINASDVDALSPFDEDLVSNLDDNPKALVEDDSSAPFQPLVLPPWLLDRGEGEGGDVLFSSSGSISTSIYNVNNFEIQAGTTIDCIGGFVIVRALTSITIAGTLNAKTIGTTPFTPLPIPFGGSGGGGGGSSTGAGLAGNDATNLVGGAGGAVNTGGSLGQNRAGATDPVGSDVVAYLAYAALGGGGAGGVGDDPGFFPSKALGGGCIILITKTLTVTGTVSVAGAVGDAALSANGGGSGGGGGGNIITVSENTQSASNYSIAGGLGGAGAGSGGAGAQGGAGSRQFYTY